jgi:hypothetical protein
MAQHPTAFCRSNQYIGAHRTQTAWRGGRRMLKGDLTSTPFAPLLLSLAEDDATG